MSTSTIPKRKMIDLHMHLIPGVDDGAEDEQMALLMLLRAKDQGIRAVFATPHSSAFDEDAEGTKAPDIPGRNTVKRSILWTRIG